MIDFLTDVVSPAPLLESLYLDFTNRAFDSIHTVPEHVFSGHAPRLRELELRNCSIVWHSPLLCGLTMLKISCFPPAARPSISQFMAALNNMPNLQVLHLGSTLITDTAAIGVGFQRLVPLPNLTHISIKSDISECILLLNHLTYPSTVFVTLLCDLSAAPHDVPYIRSLEQVFCKSKPIRHLYADYSHRDLVIQLKTFDTPKTHSKDWRDICQVDITLFHQQFIDHADPAWEDMLRTLWTSVPMTDLETMCVDACNSQFDHTWSHIFASLVAVKLKKLEVYEQYGSVFFPAFSHNALGQAEQPNQTVSLQLPALQELTLGNLKFDEEPDGKTCMERLQIYLKDRHRHQAAITKLFLKDCRRVSDNDVESLREFVRDVTWDES
jgi:hypothetical protein